MRRGIKFAGILVLCACLFMSGCPDKTTTERSVQEQEADKPVAATLPQPETNPADVEADKPVTATLPQPEANPADVEAAIALLAKNQGTYEKNAAGAVVAVNLKISSVPDQASQEELFDAINKLVDLEKAVFDGPGIDDAAILRLTNLKKVTTAHFKNANITTDSLKMLAETMQDLTDLSVNRCLKLDGSSISAITKGMPKLIKLDLQSNAFKTFDLRTLFNLAELEQLDLRQCTELQGEVLKDVAKITTLKVLRLKGRIYRDSSIENLANHPSLKALLLQDANVTDDFLDPLLTIPTLIDLTMFRLLDVSNDGMEKLKDAKLQRLMIRENDLIDDEGIAVIRTMPDLNRLILYELRAVGDEGLIAAVTGNRKLINLSLYDMESITDKSCEALKTTVALRSLELRKTGQTDETLKLAAKLPRLESVTIGDNSKFTDEGLAALGESKTLKTIAIANITGISTDGIREFRAKHPHIVVKTTNEDQSD